MKAQHLRIVQAQCDGDGPTLCQGTRLFVGEQELTGVTRIELVAEVNNVWRAKVECVVRPPADLLSSAVVTYPTLWQRFKRWTNKLASGCVLK